AVARQAGAAPATPAEEAGALRGGDGGRPRLRAADARGDGGAVHVVRRAVRAWQRAADEQLTVLEVGADFPGSDDDGGGDRPISASQRDCGTESAELPSRAGEEGQGEKPPRGDQGGVSVRGPGGGAPRRGSSLRSSPLRSAPPPGPRAGT